MKQYWAQLKADWHTASQAHTAHTVKRDLAIGMTVCLLLCGLIGWMSLGLLLHGWPHVQRAQSPVLMGSIGVGVALLLAWLTLWTMLPAYRAWTCRTDTEEKSS